MKKEGTNWKDEIIAFRDKNNFVVTYRIVEITTENGAKAFITKGDNSNTNDKGIDSIEGKYISKISGFGNILLIMQNPITLVVVLAVIAVIGFLWIVLGNNKLTNVVEINLIRTLCVISKSYNQ